jgi:hypothetical protein
MICPPYRLLARNGPVGPVAQCPLIRADRKSLAQGQTDATDPERTFDRFRFWARSEVSVPVLTLGKVALQILS